MPLSYKDQKPLYQSEFLAQAEVGTSSPYKSWFLGNGKDINNNEVDLFLIQYSEDRYNAVQVYGEREDQYISGFNFMINDLLEGKKNTAFHLIYDRAVEISALKLKTIIIGYSVEKAKELEEILTESEYFKKQPDIIDFYSKLDESIYDDEEYDKEVDKFNKSLKEYDSNYIKKYGAIPINPHTLDYMIFKSLEEAENYAKKDYCIFEEVNYINDTHLYLIAKERNFVIKTLSQQEEDNKKANK